MGIHFIFGKTVDEVVAAIKAALEADGWSGVVSGGGYVTVPAFAPCYKARVGFHVGGVSATELPVGVVLADSHSEGSVPSGVVEVRVDYSRFTNGCILVSYLKEVICLFSLSRNNDTTPFISKVIDENGSDKGLFLRCYYGKFADSSGMVDCGVSEILYKLIPNNKVLVGNVMVTVGGNFVGMLKGVLPSGASYHDLGIVHMIGSEKYIENHEYLVRFE